VELHVHPSFSASRKVKKRTKGREETKEQRFLALVDERGVGVCHVCGEDGRREGLKRGEGS